MQKAEKGAISPQAALVAVDHDVRTKIDQATERLKKFQNLGLIKSDEIVGRTVLDWECGDGSFAAALLLHGAKKVIGIDTWLNAEQAKQNYEAFAGSLDFQRSSVFDFLENSPSFANSFDAAFTCNVTEHLPMLYKQIEFLSKTLKKGAPFVISHHNYFHAIGHHDFMFLASTPKGLQVRAPACWESDEKCAASEDFRNREHKRRPWMWSAEIDNRRNPDDCSKCPYYKRARPWAHLIYADDFNDMYPRGFSSEKDGSTLNKVTPFQLRQAAIEADFSIDFEQRDRSPAEPPAELVDSGYFTTIDLQTFMYRIRCIKR